MSTVTCQLTGTCVVWSWGNLEKDWTWCVSLQSIDVYLVNVSNHSLLARYKGWLVR
jgi:hypothetical protein